MHDSGPSLGDLAFNDSTNHAKSLVALERRISRIEKFLKFRKMKEHSNLHGKVLSNEESLSVGDKLSDWDSDV